MKKLILIMIAAIALSGCTYEVGKNGKYIGYIPDTWQQGIVWKNYRVTVKPTLESSEAHTACIELDNTQAIESAIYAAENKLPVRVEYHGTEGIGFSKCTGNVVDNVLIIQE